MPHDDDLGPGPEERKLRNRLRFKLTGRWPASVVYERLVASDRARAAAVRNIATDAREARKHG